MIRPSSSARVKVLWPISPHIQSMAQALSRDGKAVALFMQGGSDQSYRWMQTSGFTSIPFMPTYTNNFALGISKTGSVVVGDAFKSGSGRRAWYWTPGGGTVVMSNGNTAYAVADTSGTMIITGSRTNGSSGWRFDVVNGLVNLPLLTDGSFTQAYTISDDGRLIGGRGDTTAPYNVEGGIPCIWDLTAGDATTVLIPPTGFDYGVVTGISEDGEWVVGTYGDSTIGDDYGFLWSVATGMISLGIGVFPTAVSSRAKIIGGTFDTGSGLQGFHMPFGGIPRAVYDIMTTAVGMSDDGLVIAGNGFSGFPRGIVVALVH